MCILFAVRPRVSLYSYSQPFRASSMLKLFTFGVSSDIRCCHYTDCAGCPDHRLRQQAKVGRHMSFAHVSYPPSEWIFTTFKMRILPTEGRFVSVALFPKPILDGLEDGDYSGKPGLRPSATLALSEPLSWHSALMVSTT